MPKFGISQSNSLPVQLLVTNRVPPLSTWSTIAQLSIYNYSSVDLPTECQRPWLDKVCMDKLHFWTWPKRTVTPLFQVINQLLRYHWNIHARQTFSGCHHHCRIINQRNCGVWLNRNQSAWHSHQRPMWHPKNWASAGPSLIPSPEVC